MSLSTRLSSYARQVPLQPRPRSFPTTSPHALRWHSSRSSLPLSAAFAAAFPPSSSPRAAGGSLRSRGAPPPPAQVEEEQGMPAFVPLRDPTPFTHPSHFHTVRWNFESPEEVGGVRYAHYDYEKHVSHGRLVLQSILSEMLWELYPRLSNAGHQSVLDRALQTTRLSIISRHYGLARKRLVGDPSALPALQRSETVQAHVFQAYIAGLILENGYATTQRWVTQAMRETAAEMYDALKREEEAKVGPKSTPSSSALGRVMEWIQKNKLEHEFTYLIEGKPPEQIFHCTLAFEGQVCKGQGASKQEARQSAAVSALVYIEQFELSATTPTSPPTHRAYSAQFYHHCHAQGVQYDLAYERVDGQDESLMKCTIRVDGKEAVGTGGRKGEAKEEASKVALEVLGIPLATLPSPTGAGEYTTKFNEYCLRHRLARTFRLERDPDGEEGWHICRLTWVGKGVPSRWVEAKGMGKQHAKNNACQAALELIGVP